MTTIDRGRLDTPIAASYERIAFGRINVRATEPLGDAAYSRFQYLVDLFTRRIDAGRYTAIVESEDPWYVTLFTADELPGVADLGNRFLLITFRHASDDADGPVFALDTENRWFAICPPEWVPLHEARADTEKLLRAIVTQWGAFEDQAAEYDLDYVTSSDPLRDWLRLHPVVTELTLWIAHTNPGVPGFTAVELDRQREHMRDLTADEAEITYRATRGGDLADVPAALTDLDDNLRCGHVQVRLVGRREDGEVDAIDSRDGLAQARVEPYHDTLSELAGRVVQTLVRWLQDRSQQA